MPTIRISFTYEIMQNTLILKCQTRVLSPLSPSPTNPSRGLPTWTPTAGWQHPIAAEAPHTLGQHPGNQSWPAQEKSCWLAFTALGGGEGERTLVPLIRCWTLRPQEPPTGEDVFSGVCRGNQLLWGLLLCRREFIPDTVNLVKTSV